MKTLRSIFRAIDGQRRISRNLKDGPKHKLVRVFWGTVYLGYALLRGVRAMRHEQGLSEVIYKGERCRISNWAGGAFPSLVGKGWHLENVPRREIANVINARELAHRFYMGINFYLGNWYDIDVNRRVGVSRKFQSTVR